jgi:hypothetical protein
MHSDAGQKSRYICQSSHHKFVQVTGPRSRFTRCAHSHSTLAMGIKGLTALIAEHAPKAISVCRLSPRRLSLRPTLNGGQEHDIKTLFGRKVAIDASMSIYQFLIAVRSKDGELLTNDAGDTTRYVSTSPRKRTHAESIHYSHLMGFFYRTIRIVENGIKPAYVFDGKPPDLKSGVVSNVLPTLPAHNSASRASWRSVSRSVKRPRRRERRPKRPVGTLFAACSLR